MSCTRQALGPEIKAPVAYRGRKGALQKAPHTNTGNSNRHTKKDRRVQNTHIKARVHERGYRRRKRKGGVRRELVPDALPMPNISESVT